MICSEMAKHHSRRTVFKLMAVYLTLVTLKAKTRMSVAYNAQNCLYLLPTGSEERGVLRVESIPVAILPSRQDVNNIAL